LPALVLVRDPEDAVLEFVIRKPSLSLPQAIRGYVRFYKPLLPHLDRVVVGAFADVTSDFGKVVRRVNERFGTTFVEFKHTDENVLACFQAIEEHYRGLYGRERFEEVVPRPSAKRDELKGSLRVQYRATSDPLRARAESLHEMLVREAQGLRPRDTRAR
jgi:hypothetical protein